MSHTTMESSPGEPGAEAVAAGLRRRRLTELYLDADPAAVNLGSTARLAAASLGFPIAQINIVDDEHQYRMVDWDVDPGQMAARCKRPRVMPRSSTMCQYTVGRGRPQAVDDARAVERYASLPGVRAGIACSYLGVPVRSREAEIIGSLCVMDRKARHITSDEAGRLGEFARVVEDQLDLLRRARETRCLSADAAATLLRAVRGGEIVPWYQPVVDLHTERVCGYEALARWVHPSGEIEDPSRFVPLAEDGELVVELDLAVARRAVTDLARWLADGRDVGVHVNLSPLHLEVDGGTAAIHDLVRAAGVDPARVTLELTESRRLGSVAHAARSVGDLRAFGFPVVLDDYGTGWSSLDWLMTLPITGLKIDRSLTCALDSRVGQAVTRATIGLARDLDLDLVLEGIASASHVARAREAGYGHGQGYFWSPPVPAETVDANPETS